VNELRFGMVGEQEERAKLYRGEMNDFTSSIALDNSNTLPLRHLGKFVNL